MFKFDRPVRRSQQALEGLIFGTLIIASVYMLLKESLKNDIVNLKSSCKSRANMANALSSFSQRLFEYYFRLRYQIDFVFCPKSLLATMAVLALASEGSTQRQIAIALEMACDVTAERGLVDNLNRSYLFLAEHNRFQDSFLSMLKVPMEEVFHTRRKLNERVVEDRAKSKDTLLVSEHVITFHTREHSLKFVMANKYDLGVNSSMDPNQDLFVAAQQKDYDHACLSVFQIALKQPDNLVLTLMTNKTNCGYDLMISDLAYIEFQDLFNINNRLDGQVKNVTLKLPAIKIESLHNLNPPIQLFNILDMFYANQAQFPKIFAKKCANFKVGIKDVAQETRLKLVATNFASLKLSETTTLTSLCGQQVLLALHTAASDPKAVILEALGKVLLSC